VKISSLLTTGGQSEIVGWGSYAITGRSSDNSYCFLGSGAIVDVNTQTGEVKLVQLVNACDAVPMNPGLYNGQLACSLTQGLGRAVMEEIVYDNQQPAISYGRPMNTYIKFGKVPTSLDVPTLANYQTFAVPYPHPDGPYGAKGIGEGILSASLPAIANAVANATGVRIYNTPMTPDKILAALGKTNPVPPPTISH